MQVVGGGHEIPSPAVTYEPTTWCDGRSGVRWRVQPAPFQASTSGPVMSLPPTAVQAVADEQVTALSAAHFDPCGCRVGVIDHVIPFHVSASEVEVAAPLA